jgi:hypothetical protein
MPVEGRGLGSRQTQQAARGREIGKLNNSETCSEAPPGLWSDANSVGCAASGFVDLDIQPNGPGGNLPIQGAIKLRSTFQILDFIGTGIRIAPEFEVSPNVPIEETGARATAALKIN